MCLAQRSTSIALLIVVASLLACGGGESEEPGTAAEAEVEESGGDPPATTSAADACPPEAEVVAIVGLPVESKAGGSMCFYETADFTGSVTIMRITPGQVDQLEREMRDSAAPYGAEVETVEVGDRARVWGSPGYGQGYAIAGDRGWLIDVSTSGSEGDMKTPTIRLLERMVQG